MVTSRYMYWVICPSEKCRGTKTMHKSSMFVQVHFIRSYKRIVPSAWLVESSARYIWNYFTIK